MYSIHVIAIRFEYNKDFQFQNQNQTRLLPRGHLRTYVPVISINLRVFKWRMLQSKQDM